MATMPGRENALRESVNSILPQCDELNIYLNELKEVPAFLNHEKINVFRSQQHSGNLGDVGKFYTCDQWQGYVFTVDDKLIYSPDYARTMIQAIESLNRKAVISAHGRITKPNCKSYYRDPEKSFRCLDAEPESMLAHIPGTGVMAFHTDTIQVKLSDFKSTNMSDIWMGVLLQKMEVPLLLLRHRARWIKISRLHDDRFSISAFCSKSDEYQTRITNSINWKLFNCPFTL